LLKIYRGLPDLFYFRGTVGIEVGAGVFTSFTLIDTGCAGSSFLFLHPHAIVVVFFYKYFGLLFLLSIFVKSIQKKYLKINGKRL
jgi:hypothetical protein